MLAQALVDRLRSEGPMSRAELARRCRVSKPTVSTLAEALLAAGLVVERGTASEGTGRPGRLLMLNTAAGYVIGMDVGGTTARAVLADLEGSWIRSERTATAPDRPEALARQLQALVDALTPGPGERERVLEIAIGTPGVVDPARRRIGIAPNVPALERDGFLDLLEAQLGASPTVMNDVKAATVGELRHGAGSDVRDLAYVSIGTGLGFGLVVDGKLHHGAGGRAGEFGLLPYPPGGPGTLEDRLSGAGMSRRHQRAGGSGRPEDAFAEADAGAEPGAAIVADFLSDLGWALAAVATMFDPERIILGGGLGLRCAPHLQAVRDAAERTLGFVPDVVVSALGDDAGLIGTIALALEPARSVGRWLKGGSNPRSRRHREKP